MRKIDNIPQQFDIFEIYNIWLVQKNSTFQSGQISESKQFIEQLLNQHCECTQNHLILIVS